MRRQVIIGALFSTAVAAVCSASWLQDSGIVEVFSRELTVNVSAAPAPAPIEEIFSRELTVNVQPAPSAVGVEEVFSRELSINLDAAPAPVGVVEVFSRELSVNIDPNAGGSSISEIFSRELSVNLDPNPPPPSTAEIFSRELSVNVDLNPTPPGIVEVFSRELSVNVDPNPVAPAIPEIFSRELSLNVSPELPSPGVVEVFSREFTLVTLLPELVVSNAAVPGTATATQAVTVSWDATNSGPVTANGPWNDLIYLSDDAALGGDTLLRTYPFAGAVLVGQTISRSTPVTIPNVSGSKYLLVVVDGGDALVENVESNNLAVLPIQVSPIPVVDLAATQIEPPATANDGQSIAVSFDVQNVGTIAANGTWGNKIWYATSPNGPAIEPPLGEFPQSGPLEAGATVTRTASVTIPPGIHGDIYFVVQTDSQGSFPEPDEANNTRIAQASTLILQPNKPDLIVDAIFPPNGTIYTNQSQVPFSYRVRNISTNGTANGSWTDKAYISTDSVLDVTQDTQVATVPVSVVLGPASSGSNTYIKTFQFPSGATAGSFTLFVVTDAGAGTGQIEEVSESNNTLSTPITIVAPTYTANITAGIVEGLGATTAMPVHIALTGQTVDLLTGQPVPDAEFSIRVVNQGTRRVFSLIVPGPGQPPVPLRSDATGSFAFDFQPEPNEAGFFQVWADHPAAAENPAVPGDTFKLVGIRPAADSVTHSFAVEQSVTAQMQIWNLGDAPVGNAGVPLSIQVAGETDNAHLEILSAPTSLDENQSGTISYRVFNPGGVPSAEVEVPIDLLIFAPVNGVVTLARSIRVRAFVSPLFPHLVLEPVSAGFTANNPIIARRPPPPGPPGQRVVPNPPAIAQFLVTNDGGASATDVRFFLPCVPNNPGCITSGGDNCTISDTLSCPDGLFVNGVTVSAIGDILPGASKPIEIALNPTRTFPDAMQPTGTLDVLVGSAEIPGLTERIYWRVVAHDLDVGSLEIRVEDEATYWTDTGQEITGGGGPLVDDGATVKLYDAVDNSLVATVVTPTNGPDRGRVRFNNTLREGFYRVTAEAPQHSSASKTVFVQAGGDTVTPVFLQTAAVTYDWHVVPTDVKDVYNITITATFNTFVPAPKIVVDPIVIDLDLNAGESRPIDFTITNQGFIAATDVTLFLTSPPGYDLTAIVHDIGTLGAGETIVVPGTLHRLSGSGLTAPDCSATLTMGVAYSFVCGVRREYWTPIYVQYPTNCAFPSGGSPPSGGGAGGVPSFYFGGPIYTNEVNCTPPPVTSDETPPDTCDKCCSAVDGGDGTSPTPTVQVASETHVGDPIYLATGEVRREETDLRIKGRGFDFAWTRKYRSKRGANTAQGNGWDFNYNLRLERSGTDLVVSNGRGRRDLFQATGANLWTRDEFFHELRRNTDGTYTRHDPDRMEYQFLAFDGGVAAGRLSRITDRNGNSMQLAYDAAGRLVTVTDTLGRDIDIAYNADGFIETITDFTNRQVVYEYYQDGDAGGARGDLKSVRSPIVLGTPNQNDFPQGKTTTYTYSTGFADERLNHNLLTVRDAKGQVFVRNTYDPTTDPSDRRFDRAIQQAWGTPDETIEVEYLPLTPTAANGFTAMRTIVNDRVANVCEYYFDVRNRLIGKREYTGRAPFNDRPTTYGSNRPVNRLRATDPEYFESRYRYNSDSLLTQIDHPNGNTTTYTYETSGSVLKRGNLIRITRAPGTYTPHGDQPFLVEEFEYLDDAGGCCGTNFIHRHRDARGNDTFFEYDTRGNRIHTTHRIASIVEDFEYNTFGQLTARVHPDNGSNHRRRDEFYYYTSGPLRGYLQSQVVDAGHFNITTTYEYDNRGNAIRIIDPRGHDSVYNYNALDQIVREFSREVNDGAGVRYVKDTFYDANDNVVRVDVENKDENGALRPNAQLSTLFEYEILNHLTRTCQELNDVNLTPFVLDCASIPTSELNSDFITTEYHYDGNRNRMLVRSPLAVSGAQPANQVLTEYDERNRVFRVTRGYGDAMVASTDQFDYDRNGNLAFKREDVFDPHVWNYRYDAYDRRIETTDPMGNVTTVHYDANSNRTNERVDGELDDDVPGSIGNVRLAETSWTYDAMDRQRFENRAFFDYVTGPIGDGQATTETVYSDNSQVVRTVNDNGHATLTNYDTANRTQTVTDAKANTVTYAYDGNSNVVAMTEVEKSDLGTPDETFVTTYAHDNHDRQTSVTDNLSHARQTRYDSRNNEVQTIDPRGNVVKNFHDGLDRLVRTERVMTSTGEGSGAVLPYADWIVTYQRWDAASRLVGQTDDNFNETQYEHDALNRKRATVYADGTRFDTTYNRHDEAIQIVDANGSVVTMTYDSLHRIKTKDVQRGTGVVGTTFETYQHDGISRMKSGRDDDSLITMNYDSRSNLIEEAQNGHVIAAEFDGVGNQSALVYPDGRVVTTTYDLLERKATISAGGSRIVAYSFVGPSRAVRKDYGNSTRMNVTYNGARQIVRTEHLRDPAGTASVLDDRSYAWNASNSQTAYHDIVNNKHRTYVYDSANRLVRSARVESSNPSEQITYELDGVGSRNLVMGGLGAGAYSCDSSLPEPADCQVNQYTATPFGVRAYDHVGNTSAYVNAAASIVLQWDYAGRLVRVVRGSTIMCVYEYDVFGRCTGFEDNNASVTAAKIFWSRWMQLEADAPTGREIQAKVMGIGVNEVVAITDGARWITRHEDSLGSAVVATDADAVLLEKYEYSDFGYPYFNDSHGAAIGGSAIGMNDLFAGMTWQPSVTAYYARRRHYAPDVGQFLSSDPLGAWFDSTALGNTHTYAGNAPPSATDPYGLAVYVCGRFFKAHASWPPLQYPHGWVCVDKPDGTKSCIGYYPKVDRTECETCDGPGYLSIDVFDEYDAQFCEKVSDSPADAACILAKAKPPSCYNGLPIGSECTNCFGYRESLLKSCGISVKPRRSLEYPYPGGGGGGGHGPCTKLYCPYPPVM